MWNLLLLLLKLLLGSVALLLALLTALWGYGIYNSIGRVRTQSAAGEFMTPNDADVYPIFFVFCAVLLWAVISLFRDIPWPWLSDNRRRKTGAN
ncbi:hypothetical protein [Hymenobacter cellulosivorans]|uniref:Uncharacterized protein n=1 Tax=Hymenobacter cellulosivorans TaxID=2932249 RepID=A0ABY4F7T6_9BACT|nr:hypothetical protein [Hymenobacter cellulosivorans]UOQ52734.1 hypothetical protein MUN80_23680 [Hymenobacter cellulosivorans]